jgi:tRNA threonylcarbamoyladenosine biosynthesis protein TsaE
MQWEHTMTSLSLASSSEERSRTLGEALGHILEAGDVVALWGELGAGKTFLAGAIARGMGVPPTIPLTSPTFTLINEYDGRLHLYHLDLYRIEDPREMDTLPWRDVLYGEGVALVEWPERLGSSIPVERWDVVIEITGDKERRLTIRAEGDRNARRLDASRAALVASISAD